MTVCVGPAVTVSVVVGVAVAGGLAVTVTVPVGPSKQPGAPPERLGTMQMLASAVARAGCTVLVLVDGTVVETVVVAVWVVVTIGPGVVRLTVAVPGTVVLTVVAGVVATVVVTMGWGVTVTVAVAVVDDVTVGVAVAVLTQGISIAAAAALAVVAAEVELIRVVMTSSSVTTPMSATSRPTIERRSERPGRYERAADEPMWRHLQ